MAFEIGGVLTLNCTWLPTPATNVTWYHEDQVIPADMATLMDNSTSQLRVPDVTREDAGAYTCASSEGFIFHKYNVSIGCKLPGSHFEKNPFEMHFFIEGEGD